MSEVFALDTRRARWQVCRWAVLAVVAVFICLVGQTTVESAQSGTAEPTSAGTEPAPGFLTLTGHTSGVTVLAWSPDGKRLVSATGGFGNFESTDFTVRLWDRQGATLAVLTDHTGPVSSLAWSPDSSLLASGANDATIRLWGPDGAPIKRLTALPGTVFSLAWSPDGNLLAAGIVAGPSQNWVELWRADGTFLRALSTPYSGGKFYNLGWSPDGRYLVGGAVSYTEWRENGTRVFSYPGCAQCTPFWGFAWAPDSSRWAVGDESGFVQIYTVEGKLGRGLANPGGNVDALAWSPDGQLLAGGSVVLWDADGTVQASIATRGSRISRLTWSPDGHWLAASDGTPNAPGNTIYLWHRQKNATLQLNGHTAPVGALAWSPEGDMLASGSLDQTIRLWQRATFEHDTTP